MTNQNDAFYVPELFKEPESFTKRSIPSPTFHVFERTQDKVGEQSIQIRLVGNHGLWAHCLWNAGICLARYLDDHSEIVNRKTMLELGAGAALPSIIAALNGAKQVVITDYPDRELIENIEFNVNQNIKNLLKNNCVHIMGYLWGRDPNDLIQRLDGDDSFDVIILSDLLFNHSQHGALLETCQRCLRKCPNAMILVAYTSHRPHLAHKDTNFFTLAQDSPYNFKVTKLFDQSMTPMFEDDLGDVNIRSTVHMFLLTWAHF